MLVEALPTQGYFVDWQTTRGGTTEYIHTFCGQHSITTAWCPSCKKPLHRLLKLDPDDDRLELLADRSTEVSLYYCWRCNLAKDDFTYRLLISGELEIIDVKRGGVQRDFPYRGYPLFFPGTRVELVPLSEEEQSILWDLNDGSADRYEVLQTRPDLYRPRHQIGGEPLLLQDDCDREIRCRNCGKPMKYFACLGNACLDPRGIVGTDFAQIMYYLCRDCVIITAFNRAD